MSNDLFGPIVVGTPISVDEWVRPPARPPKNPNLLRKPLRTEK